MTRLNVSKAQKEFAEVVNRAAYGKELTIVSLRRKDLAAVIPIDDLPFWSAWPGRKWTAWTSKTPAPL